MPRLAELHRATEELVDLALRVATAENRAGRWGDARVAMDAATHIQVMVTYIGRELRHDGRPPAPRRRPLLRRVAEFWDYLLSGR